MSSFRRPKYPSAWTRWEWNDYWQKESRYRQIADTGNPDVDYQWDYRDPRAPRGTTTPADALATIREAPARQDDYQTAAPGYSNYTFNTSDITGQLARTSLGPGQRASYVQAESYSRQSTYAAVPPRASDSGRFIRAKHSKKIQGPLDENFKLHKSREFKFGKVFKILWTEPKGETGTDITNVKRAKYDEDAYSSIRRFVVVNGHEGHSLCVPILTYGGQGTNKPGVKPKDHCIVYTTPKPVMLQGEEITNRSLRMVPDNPRDKLDPASRMNYAKVYTIEHNVKVHFIGRIAEKYEPQFISDYNRIHKPLEARPSHPETETEEVVYSHAQGGHEPESWPGQPGSYSSSTIPRIAPYTVSYSAAPSEPGQGTSDAQPQPHAYDESLYDEN